MLGGSVPGLQRGGSPWLAGQHLQLAGLEPCAGPGERGVPRLVPPRLGARRGAGREERSGCEALRGLRGLGFARALLDNEAFWARRDVVLEEAPGPFLEARCRQVGVRPNVCHFEASRWVWSNSKDEALKGFCAPRICDVALLHIGRGALDVPEVYSDEVLELLLRPWMAGGGLHVCGPALLPGH